MPGLSLNLVVSTSTSERLGELTTHFSSGSIFCTEIAHKKTRSLRCVGFPRSIWVFEWSFLGSFKDNHQD